MIVSIQSSPHSFRSRVIVHRTRPRIGLFKFALVVFGCNIDKMSHIAFMEVDENWDGQGLSISFVLSDSHVGGHVPGWLAGCVVQGRKQENCVLSQLCPPK